MFFQKTLAFLILICVLFSAQSFAQQQTLSPSVPKEIPVALKQNAVALLRETLKDIQNLKAPENRAFFSIEAANLLWAYDEPQARQIFQTAMNDLKQSLAQVAAEAAKLQTEEKEEQEDNVYAANAAYQVYYGLEPELRGRIQKIVRLRLELISALAKNDPQMADDFLQDTAKILDAAKLRDAYGFRDIYGTSDASLKTQIAVQMAKNDPDKAANIARRMLTEGFSWGIITILNAVYEQNADKGSKLAEDIQQKIISSNPPKTKTSEVNYFTVRFFRAVSASLELSKTTPDKKSLLPESSVRELANYLGKTTLNESNFEYGSSFDVADAIEKYEPEKAAQIRAEQKKVQERYGNVRISSNMTTSNIMTANVSANTAVTTNSNSAMQTSEEVKKTRERAQKIAEKEKQIKATEEAITEKIKQKNLSAEEKQYVVEQIRKFAANTLPRRREDKIKTFVYWAAQSAAGGNAEIAQTLLREAESLVKPQAKNAVDYMSKWHLAEGYSKISPEKSFSILEEIFPPFNSVIAGFVKVGEFVDESQEIASNDEILVGTFPLGNMEVLSVLPGSGYVARNLATADFARTKNLIDKFERLEFRLMARMLLLKSLLKPEELTKTKNSEIDYELY